MTEEELQQIEEDATEFVEGNTNVIERPTVAGLLSLIAKLKHENLRYQKALERDLSETLYLQDWRQQAEKARTREDADNVRIQVLRQEKEALENALKEAYATNTDLHRRVQQVESPFQSEVANLQNLVEGLREECHKRRTDYCELLEKYRESDKKISELRDALREAQEDTQRLDWLEAQARADGWTGWTMVNGILVANNGQDTLRETIDQAMRQVTE